MPSRCKCLPAAGEEDGEDVEYGVREIRVPVATGWKFKLFLQAMQSPLFPPIKTFVFKNSGVHNVILHAVPNSSSWFCLLAHMPYCVQAHQETG